MVFIVIDETPFDFRPWLTFTYLDLKNFAVPDNFLNFIAFKYDCQCKIAHNIAN